MASLSSKRTTRDISESLGKLPPQALDLEEAVLGAALLSRRGVLVALEILTPDDFYLDANREIFQAITDLSNNGHPIDMRTVKDQLSRNGKLELIGGAYVLAELTSKVSSDAHIEYHARVVQEKRMLRDMITIASQIHLQAYEDNADPFELLALISRFPLDLADKIKSSSERHIKEGVILLAESINKREADTPEMLGVPSGYPKIDKITLGWRNGKLIIIAARPAMGKTTFALNCARNAAVDFNVPVGIFSLEMLFLELSAIFAAMSTDIELRHIESKPFSPLDMERFIRHTVKLTQAPIYIDDTPSLSINAFRTKARRMVEKYGVKMLIVDYIQLMRGDVHDRRQNREQEISSISRGLKLVAMELNIPVLAISQLSREVEKQPNCKPKLSNLRESGSLEQDADIVALLWRPQYYKITGDDRGTFIDGVTEVSVAKHRGGAIGEPFIQMRPQIARFLHIDSPYAQDLTATQQDPPPPKPQSNDDLPF